MKSRTVTLVCDAGVAGGLGRALRVYAQAAYPPGGSECGQVAREALLDTAQLCETHPGGELVLRKRIMPQLRAAVRWCLSQDGPLKVELPPGLEALLATNSKSA